MRCRGGYHPPANVANFWVEPNWPNLGSDVANVPCFDIVPQNFNGKCSALHCRRFAPTLFFRRENNRADNIRPYECAEIFARVIRRHIKCADPSGGGAALAILIAFLSLHSKMSGQRKQSFLPANTKNDKMKRIIA